MKSIIRFIVFFFSFITIAGATIFIIQPRIPISGLTSFAASVFNFFSDNNLTIQGSYYLTPGEWILIKVNKGILEMDKENIPTVRLEIETSEINLNILSLLKKELILDGVSIQGFSLNIAQKEKQYSETHIANKQESDGTDVSIPLALKQIGNIDISDFSVSLTNSADTPTTHVQIDECKGGLFNATAGKLEIKGAINDHLLQASLDIGPLANLTSETPLAFAAKLSHKSITAAINGQFDYREETPELDSDFLLSGDHFDDLTSVFGMQSSRNMPFSIQGQTSFSPHKTRVLLTKLSPLAENLTASLIIHQNTNQKTKYAVSVEGKVFDVDALSSLLGDYQEKSNTLSEQSDGKNTIEKDDVIIPPDTLIRDIDFVLDLDRLVIAGNEISTLKISAAIKDGVISNAPFQATFDNSTLDGFFSLDFNTSTPKISTQFTTKSWDIGATLSQFGLAQDIDISIEDITSDYTTSGRTLREFVKNLKFSLKANDGRWIFKDPNTGSTLPIAIRSANLTGEPGKEIVLDIDGDIDTHPVKITTSLEDRRDEPFEKVKEIPFSQTIILKGLKWELDGIIPYPYKLEGLTLNSTFTGDSFSDLNSLLKIDLPQTDPYTITGYLQVIPEGYKLSKLDVQIGSSSLNGNLLFNTTKKPPKLELDLSAQKIQLDDFRRTESPPATTTEKSDTHQREKKQTKNKPTDQEVLESFDADIVIEVNEVISGSDYLGKGLLKIKQEHGKLNIAPLQITFPKGEVTLDFSLHSDSGKHNSSFSLFIKELDYGVVGRLYKPESDMKGIINLRTSLQATSSNFTDFMPNSSGYFDFSLQPENIRSGVIDYWAINLFSFLIPFLTPNDESTLNCMAGRFNIADGVLDQEELLIDTTRMQVKGEVNVDFPKKKIEARLRPIPKRPQFYSLATPIEISGSFDKINAGVTTGGIIGTVIRLATSYIVVPIQWIILDKLPADNTDKCLQLVEER